MGLVSTVSASRYRCLVTGNSSGGSRKYPEKVCKEGADIEKELVKEAAERRKDQLLLRKLDIFSQRGVREALLHTHPWIRDWVTDPLLVSRER